MKITRVEAFVIRHPSGAEVIDAPAPGATRGGPGLWNRLDDYATAYPKGAVQATLVKITTASGLVGWGQCHAPVAPRIHQAVVQDMLAPLLLGQDARDVEVLWDRLYASQRLRAYQSGPFTQTLAGVDLALWDLLGKHAGVPVYQLLGGIFRDRLPLYLWIRGNSPQSVAEATRQAVARGYSAVKMNVAGIHQIDLATAASQAMGNRGQVLVVCVGLKLYEAIRIGRELDKLGNIGWLQEPLLPEDHTGYVKLAAAVETPICHGAFFGTRFRARDVLASKGADILNPDICYCGGLTETRRITILAETYGVLWSPHISMATPLLIAASLHLAAASPNFVIMESAGQESGPFGNALLKQPLLVEQGYAAVPGRPGLGVEFHDEALARLRVS